MMCFFRTPYCSVPSVPITTSTFCSAALPQRLQNSLPASCGHADMSHDSLCTIHRHGQDRHGQDKPDTLGNACYDLLFQRPIMKQPHAAETCTACNSPGLPIYFVPKELSIPGVAEAGRGGTLQIWKHALQRSAQRRVCQMRLPSGATRRSPICRATFCIA